MHSFQNARAKNIPTIGNVVEAFQSFRNMIPPNDGVRKYKQLIKNSYPTMFNGDAHGDLQITDREFDITALNDSFIQVEGVAQYRMDCESAYHTTAAVQEKEQPHYVFVGFKSSAQFIRQLQLLINDRPDLCDFLNPNILQESYAYLACSSETKRENKSGMYSLWEDVWKKSPFVCGNYIPLSEIRRNNGVGTFRYKYSIPINDILAFQAIDMFPSSIMGTLKLIMSFQFLGAVWCPVSPLAVDEQLDYMGVSNGNEPATLTAMDRQISHEFLQVGVEWGKAMLVTSDVAQSLRSMRMNITSFTVEKLKSYISGYNIDEQAKSFIHNSIRQSPVLIPAQKLERLTFGTGLISHGQFDATISTTLRNINCISVMFATNEGCNTVFRNPMLRNLQLSIGNTQYPPERISTLQALSPEFVTNQLQACELDGEIVPSKSFMNSLTQERLLYTIDSAGNANVTGRLTRTVCDGTDFLYTIATERKQSGFVFDGLSTESNTTINLKFEPIATDPADNVYVNYDPVNYPGRTPSAPVLHMCKDCFWVMGIGNDGPYMLFNDKTLDPV